jgi:hypothetical protein
MAASFAGLHKVQEFLRRWRKRAAMSIFFFWINSVEEQEKVCECEKSGLFPSH